MKKTITIQEFIETIQIAYDTVKWDRQQLKNAAKELKKISEKPTPTTVLGRKRHTKKITNLSIECKNLTLRLMKDTNLLDNYKKYGKNIGLLFVED